MLAWIWCLFILIRTFTISSLFLGECNNGAKKTHFQLILHIIKEIDIRKMNKSKTYIAKTKKMTLWYQLNTFLNDSKLMYKKLKILVLFFTSISRFVVLLAKAYTSSPSQIGVKRTSEDPHQLQKKNSLVCIKHAFKL